jgi:catechol 2,3-dioxygenase-like lactoylglutathione lyase family enzyme
VTSLKSKPVAHESGMTNWHIGYVTLLVTDYDEAEAQYRSVLGFELIEERRQWRMASVGFWWCQNSGESRQPVSSKGGTSDQEHRGF